MPLKQAGMENKNNSRAEGSAEISTRNEESIGIEWKKKQSNITKIKFNDK